ncbi:MAG: hypothetical protein NT133_24225 [Alphaproteobacteria bacterium]|nr:hypothetical protein [Alphaproteobacteria bacterium]
MYRRYNFALATLLLLGFTCGLAATVILDPLDGDLTRIGGFSENRFGWAGTQEKFVPPLAVAGQPGGRYDIVVVGDSFSTLISPDRQHRAGTFWTDHLAALTGLTVGVFDISTTHLDTLVESLAATPPHMLIIETVERFLWRLPDVPGDCRPVTLVPVELPQAAAPAIPQGIRRVVTISPDPRRLAEVMGHIGTALLSGVTRRDINKAALRPLSRADLFSSAEPDALLFYTDDLARAAWTEADWNGIACRIRAIQAMVTRRLGSGFLLVVAPDKSSAYAPYLPPADRPVDAIARLAGFPDIALVRLDLAFRRLIAQGVRDLYLPNDTHWSSAGARVAAEAVLAHGR